MYKQRGLPKIKIKRGLSERTCKYRLYLMESVSRFLGNYRLLGNSYLRKYHQLRLKEWDRTQEQHGLCILKVLQNRTRLRDMHDCTHILTFLEAGENDLENEAKARKVESSSMDSGLGLE